MPFSKSYLIVIFGLIALAPWVLWQGQWVQIIVEQLDHCPILMCDFELYYKPQAQSLISGSGTLIPGWLYPPLLALILIPIGLTGQASLGWGVILILSLFTLVYLALSPVNRRIPQYIIFGILFASSSLTILHGLKWGQVSLPLIVLCIWGLKKSEKGGWILGLAAALKGYPIVYLLYPLIRLNDPDGSENHDKTKKKLKVILKATVGFLLLGVVLPMLVIGWETTAIMFERVLDAGGLIPQASLEFGGQSLMVMLQRNFSYGAHIGLDGTDPRIFNLGPSLSFWLWFILSLVLAFLSFKTIRSESTTQSESISIFLCWVGLMLPPGWHHYFCFLPFAQLQLMQGSRKQTTTLLLVLSIVIDRIPVFMLGFNEKAYALSSAYGVTTLSVLFCWGALVYHAYDTPKHSLQHLQNW